MKANEFVKKFGWDFAKLFANGWITFNNDCDNNICRNDVKRLVESYELVESLGGLDEAKKRLQQANEEFSILISFKSKSGAICSVYDHVLTKAIADVGSCQ